MGNLLACILVFSIILQLASAGYALVLIRKSGFFRPWFLIAAAITLMGIRRIVSFSGMLRTGNFPVDQFLPELIALAISVLMFSGLLLFGPAFEMIKRRREYETEQNEVLLRESHHHVKNDLQILRSLVHLQLRTAKTPRIKAILTELDLRIGSFLHLHEQIYRKGVSGVSFYHYIAGLAASVESAYNNPKVKIVLDISDFPIERKELLYCGVIVTEALTNAYKYAFANTKDPVITIANTTVNGQNVLSVTDNGCGFDVAGTSQTDSYGLFLINSIGGSYEWQVSINGDNGTSVEVTFPSAERKPD